MEDKRNFREIVTSFESDRDSIVHSITRNDIVSINLRERRLQELKIKTHDKLKAIRDELLSEWKNLNDDLLHLINRLNIIDNTDVNAIAIQSETIEAKMKEIAPIKEEIDEINIYIQNNLNIHGEKLPNIKPFEEPKEELIDYSNELDKNSKELENIEDDVLPFDIVRQPETTRERFIKSIYETATSDVPRLTVSDSKSKYVSVNDKTYGFSIDSTQSLPQGEYIDESSFVAALNKYIEAEKNRKYVIDSLEGTLDESTIRTIQETLNKCVKLVIDKDKNVRIETSYSIEPIGTIGDDVEPGKYVSSSDAIYSIGSVIENPESNSEIIARIIKELRK